MEVWSSGVAVGPLEQRVEAIDRQAGAGVKLVASVIDALHEKMTALQPTSPDVVEMKNAILDALADHRRRLAAADRKTEL